jgi:hypothetical protein
MWKKFGKTLANFFCFDARDSMFDVWIRKSVHSNPNIENQKSILQNYKIDFSKKSNYAFNFWSEYQIITKTVFYRIYWI